MLNTRSARCAFFMSIFLSWGAHLSAQAPEAAAPSQELAEGVDLAQEAAELSHDRSLRSTADNPQTNPAATTFVESATAIEAWAISLGNKSSLQGYQFPVAISVNPFRIADPYDERWHNGGIWRNLGQSQLSASYAPVVVQPRSDMKPGVAESAARSLSGSYKIVLLGTREMDDNLKTLTGLGQKGLQEALNDPKLSAGATAPAGSPEKVAFDTAAAKYIAAALPALQADLRRQLTVALKLSYQGDSRPEKPNAASAELDLSKILGQPGTELSSTPLSLGGSLSRRWFGRSEVGATYEQTSLAFGPTLTVKKGLDLSLQGQVDRFSGLGFQGIQGVTDTSRRTDIGLVQAANFQLPINGALTLSVTESHLGTGNTDVGLAAMLSLKPGLKNPPPSH